MHSLEARPKAYAEYMEKENAPPYGRISTHMSFSNEMFGRISRERLVSVMLNCLCHSASAGGGRGATALPFSVATSATLPLRHDIGGFLPAAIVYCLLSFPFICSFAIEDVSSLTFLIEPSYEIRF